MKWLCTKTNELSHRTGIGNMKLFIALSTVICGIAGCVAALILHMIPLFDSLPFVELEFICGGYGAFLFGMMGSALYLLIKEPLSESRD